jgi:hypothetical protein
MVPLVDHLGDRLRRALQFKLGREAYEAGVVIHTGADLTNFALRQAQEK